MRNMTSRNFALFFLAVAVSTGAILGQGPEPMAAPEGIPIESQWMYTKHYAQVEEIMKLPLGQKEVALENFYKKVHPKALIRQYMGSFLMQVVKEYGAAGNKAAADQLQEKIHVASDHHLIWAQID